MKVRIPKQSKEERIKASVNSSNFTIELGKPITQIDEKIKNQYEKLVKEYGELRRLDIIEYMKTTEFISLFSPATPPIRKRINESVSRLGEEIILKDLKKSVGNMQRDYNFTLETIVEKMKSGDFSLKLKKLLPDSLANIAEKAVNKFIEEKAEELKNKQAEEQDTLLHTQEDSSSKSSKEQLKEDIKSEDENNQSEEQAIDTKTNKETTKMSIEERQYFEKVKKFTNGFDFLARDLSVYISETGKQDYEKFDSLDEYTRFIELQEKVRQAMVLLKTNESGAIKAILDKSDGRLNNVDFNILNARQQELNKRKNLIGLPNEQEM